MHCAYIRPTALIINTAGEVGQEAPGSGGQRNEAELSPSPPTTSLFFQQLPFNEQYHQLHK